MITFGMTMRLLKMIKALSVVSGSPLLSWYEPIQELTYCRCLFACIVFDSGFTAQANNNELPTNYNFVARIFDGNQNWFNSPHHHSTSFNIIQDHYIFRKSRETWMDSVEWKCLGRIPLKIRAISAKNIY